MTDTRAVADLFGPEPFPKGSENPSGSPSGRVPRVADHVPAGTSDLDHMARVMEAHGDRFAAVLAHYIRGIDTQHACDGPYCTSCGVGDTSWPCEPWMAALRLCISWLVTQLGTPEPQVPLTEAGIDAALSRADDDLLRYSWLQAMRATTGRDVEYFAIDGDGERADWRQLHSSQYPCRGLPNMHAYHHAGHVPKLFTKQDGDNAVARGTRTLCPVCFADGQAATARLEPGGTPR
jgi:hypothetical protein